MEAIQFDTTMQSNGKIELPAEYKKNINKNTKLRVIVLINNSKENAKDAWQNEATKNFFADDIYNNL